MTEQSAEPRQKELLPCPFCGSKEVELTRNNTGAYYQIVCLPCRVKVWNTAKRPLLNCWNKRAPVPVAGEVTEEKEADSSDKRGLHEKLPQGQKAIWDGLVNRLSLFPISRRYEILLIAFRNIIGSGEPIWPLQFAEWSLSAAEFERKPKKADSVSDVTKSDNASGVSSENPASLQPQANPKEECVQQGGSSRMCEWGTKACEVRHKQPRPKEGEQ